MTDQTVRHLSSLQEYFYKLYKTETLCDLSLITKTGTTVLAHKLVVAAFSGAVRTEVEKLENALQVYITVDCEDLVLREILEFIYTGKIGSNEELFPLIENASRTLQLISIQNYFPETYQLSKKSERIGSFTPNHLLSNKTQPSIDNPLSSKRKTLSSNRENEYTVILNDIILHDIKEEFIPGEGELVNCTVSDNLDKDHMITSTLTSSEGPLDNIHHSKKVVTMTDQTVHHLSSLQKYFYKLYKTQTLCDLLLKTKTGTTVLAHKLVVAAFSGAVRTEVEKLENALQVYITVDCEDLVLREILEFIYTGKIGSNEEFFPLIKNASRTLQLISIQNYFPETYQLSDKSERIGSLTPNHLLSNKTQPSIDDPLSPKRTPSSNGENEYTVILNNNVLHNTIDDFIPGEGESVNCTVSDNLDKDHCTVSDNLDKDNCTVSDNLDKDHMITSTFTSSEGLLDNIHHSKKVVTKSMSKRKRNDLTLSDKYEVVKLLDKGKKQTEICKQLYISQAQVSRIKGKKDKIRLSIESNSNTKRRRQGTGKDAEVEKALLEWYKNARLPDIPLSGPILAEKAKDLAQKLDKPDFVPTSGWLERWKGRNNIVYKKTHKEKKDADTESAEEWTTTTLPDILQSFDPNDIYNADETGIYYSAIPAGTLADKYEKITGSKSSRDHITALVAVNMTGTDKRPLLVIGKSKWPRCFRGISHLPVEYNANSNAWMTSDIFTRWLKSFNQDMQHQQRKVILLVDNCTAHLQSAGHGLKNVVLKFLTPNTTSTIQPCDQGIIRKLKSYYRSSIVKKIIIQIECSTETQITATTLSHKLTLLDALHELKKAWKQVTTTTVINSYKKGGFLFPGTNSQSIDTEPETNIIQPPELSAEQFNQYVNIDTDLQCTGLLSDEDICNSIKAERPDNQNPTASCSDDEEPAAAPRITSSEMLNALRILRQGFENNGHKDFTNFYNLEDEVESLIQKKGKTWKV